ncbi:hypothetical protein ACQP2F_18990 [Actinoplanes sp. CA-030573]|uniref:hypothetical protein n=1 Tax=Actinoplanes sp. CA-030573 TaxID=3239898 RepID=UPI003D94C456
MRYTVHIDRLVLHDLGLSGAELAGLAGRIEAELAARWSAAPPAARPGPGSAAPPAARPGAGSAAASAGDGDGAGTVAGSIARAVAGRMPGPGGTP